MSISASRILCVVFAFSFYSSTIAHEDANHSPPVAKAHALYHQVMWKYPYVDQQQVAIPMMDGKEKMQTRAYFIHPDGSTLYVCSPGAANVDGLCFDLLITRANGNWDYVEARYGKENGLKPVERIRTSTVPVLDVKEPFSQFSNFVYYLGNQKVVKCRWTFTQYNFQFERNGQPVFIESNKQDEVREKCEQVYPNNIRLPKQEQE